MIMMRPLKGRRGDRNHVYHRAFWMLHSISENQAALIFSALGTRYFGFFGLSPTVQTCRTDRPAGVKHLNLVVLAVRAWVFHLEQGNQQKSCYDQSPPRQFFQRKGSVPQPAGEFK
ncbi:hypothetical protein JQ615_18060 [Bradyrhizobium jicamae]|uniref:Transposase n=1 Tax=Bradyrhizobium jicamae TaxID=280332 RepID=A0ABS5FLP5_9BRAD|nr:hypothetical protein [Bradyrhizobium jicamae]MBR0797296.1 hypothetical protein [Bradyrhizobium jicamae]